MQSKKVFSHDTIGQGLT